MLNSALIKSTKLIIFKSESCFFLSLFSSLSFLCKYLCCLSTFFKAKYSYLNWFLCFFLIHDQIIRSKMKINGNKRHFINRSVLPLINLIQLYSQKFKSELFVKIKVDWSKESWSNKKERLIKKWSLEIPV